MARRQQPVLIKNTSYDKRWLQRPDDANDRTGPKSAVSVPILACENLVGVITLVHPQPGFFTEEHLYLVQTIAGQAGIAILNARLYIESQRQAKLKEALAESAVAITGSLDLGDVLRRILEQISQALYAERVSLALLNSQSGELEYRAVSSPSQQDRVGGRISIGEGIAGWVAQTGQGVIVQDIHRDLLYYPEAKVETSSSCDAILCAPIRSEGQLIGVLEVASPAPASFDENDLKLLEGIGAMAGTAIRHAQFYQET